MAPAVPAVPESLLPAVPAGRDRGIDLLPEEHRKQVLLNLSLTTHEDIDELPRPDELGRVAELRSNFAGELALREAEGRDYPPFFGDIFLTRVLRGCDGQMEMAIEWFTRYLGNFQRFDVDTLYARMAEQLEAHPDQPYGDASMLPHADELRPYINEIYHYPKASSRGDLINYFAFCDVNQEGLVEAGLVSKWAAYHNAATVLRIIVLDRESRRQGRMVKTIWVADLAGTALSRLQRRFTPEEEAYQAASGEFDTSMSAEIMRKMYFVNGPWWCVMIWRVFQRYIPERFKAKVGVLDGNGLDDPAFVELMGGEAALAHMLSSRMGLVSNRPSGEVSIYARDFLEYTVSVTGGQTVMWTSAVQASSMDFMVGSSSVVFSVTAKWGCSLADIERWGHLHFQEEVVPAGDLAADRGEVSGSFTAPRGGVLVLRWSNEHSMMRARLVRYTTRVVDFEERASSFSGASDAPAAAAAGGQPVDKPPGRVDIRAGSFFEESLSVLPGQTISWTTEVLRGRADALAGTPDVGFQVLACWVSREGRGQRLPVVFVPESRVRASPGGAARGSFRAPQSGSAGGAEPRPEEGFYEVVLRWSNAHSRLRRKTVKYSVTASLPAKATYIAEGAWFFPDAPDAP